MKKLKLKLKDLTNPSILTSREINAITGGYSIEEGAVYCKIFYYQGFEEIWPNQYYSCFDGSVDACQQNANNICWYQIEHCSFIACGN